MFDVSTKKRLYFAGCVLAQVFCIGALALQGSRLKEIYDAKHWLESNGVDLTGSGVLTHICLFISVIVFGSLKQLLVWPGLLLQNFCLVIVACPLDLLNIILCITLHFMYGGHTSLPAWIGVVSGFMSSSMCGRLASTVIDSN